MSPYIPPLLAWLRAAGESTRLRLLALCTERDLSVSDLATVIRQSEPRVSRHLKILSEAGLIERVRQGQWVHYQAAQDGASAGFVQGLLAQLDRSEGLFARDREWLKGKGEAQTAAAADSRLGRALRAFIGESHERVSSALVVGIDHPDLMAAAAGLAGECVALAGSRRAAQGTRSFAEREGVSCRVVLRASGAPLSERELLRIGAPFDLIVLDRIAATADRLSAALTVTRAALKPGGRLWLFEQYESLEAPRAKVVEHPIGRIRRLLAEAGFTCERLSPIEADGQHVLAATASAVKESNTRAA